jgi:hypothetical protein
VITGRVNGSSVCVLSFFFYFFLDVEICWVDSIFHVEMRAIAYVNNVTFRNIQGGLFGVVEGTLNLQQNNFEGITQTVQQYHSAKKIAYCNSMILLLLNLQIFLFLIL